MTDFRHAGSPRIRFHGKPVRVTCARNARRENTTEGRSAFTLIELVLVMALLAIAASLTAPRMATFFRGQALDQEARRLLSLAHYGQSRAASEGVPVELWVDPSTSRYGLEIQPGFRTDDPRAVVYTVDGNLRIEAIASQSPPPYEDDLRTSAETVRRDSIVFQPDGLPDPSSVSEIRIHETAGETLALALNASGLGYELIRPHETTRR